MLSAAREVYRSTRKQHDQLWNAYVMRPLAAVVVAALGTTRVTPNQLTLLNLAIFIAGAALLVALPSQHGGLWAVAVLELSYLFDCADGMLARHKQLASKAGHLFDFFTDELKATLLVATLGVRLFRTGGTGFSPAPELWPAGDPRFLIAGLAGTLAVASALSLTNFVRRPELSGRETTIESHYEAEAKAAPRVSTSALRRAAGLAATFLKFLNHYPSHIWVFALVNRFDIFFWMYFLLNAAYVARGWLGLVFRFGRFGT